MTRRDHIPPAPTQPDGPRELRTGTFLTWLGRRWRVREQLNAHPCGRCRVAHHDYWVTADISGDRQFLPGCRLHEISAESR